MTHRFPFGAPVRTCPPTMPATGLCAALVLGVYPSALHVRWSFPYAQASHEIEGSYREVVSEEHLPRDEWPILVTNLERDGWCSPSEPDQNWSRSLDDVPLEASRALLGGLRDGRVCRDPSLLSWRVGTFPPGPDGGEPVRCRNR